MQVKCTTRSWRGTAGQGGALGAEGGGGELRGAHQHINEMFTNSSDLFIVLY